MNNKLNIDDEVKVIKPGLNPDGVIVKIDSMHKWSDGVIHYGGTYTGLDSNGDPRNIGVQFTEDQCPSPDIKSKSIDNLKTHKESTKIDRKKGEPINELYSKK